MSGKNPSKKNQKTKIPYKKLKNYDPDSGLPAPWEKYVKYEQPEPPKKQSGQGYKLRKTRKRRKPRRKTFKKH